MEKSKIASQRWLWPGSVVGRRINPLEILFFSLISLLCHLKMDHWQRTAVQSSWPDLVDYSPALPELSAQRACLSNSAANVQRSRAGAQANHYVKQLLAANTYKHPMIYLKQKYRQNAYIYVQYVFACIYIKIWAGFAKIHANNTDMYIHSYSPASACTCTYRLKIHASAYTCKYFLYLSDT
jgi:hypothetical protein